MFAIQRVFTALCCASLVASCSGAVDGGPDSGITNLGAPSSSISSSTTVRPVSPMEVRGAAGGTARYALNWYASPMGEDMMVFVHFVRDGVIQFGDDYWPEQGTSQWSGAVVHERDFAIPDYASGQYDIFVGLYQTHAPWDRVSMSSEGPAWQDDQQRYWVGTLSVGEGGGEEPTNPPVDPPSGDGPAGAAPGSYGAMTFHDEFNGSSVDYSVWRKQMWWVPEHDLDTHRVEDGVVKMWSAKHSDGSWEFNNVDLNTDGTFAQRYGWFEIEAKLPPGPGQWPSFWLYAHNDATRPEIDIMEAYSCLGGDWCDGNRNPNDYTGTLWMGDEGGGAEQISQRRATEVLGGLGALSDDFHRYGAHWEPDGVTFFFDGRPLGDKIWTDRFNQEMYVVLGVGPFHEPLWDTPSGIEWSYQVNYVRVWADQ